MEANIDIEHQVETHDSESSAQTFENFFPLLPKEIQHMIWKFAVPPVPSHATFQQGIVRVIINLDLSHPRAILFPVSYYQADYQLAGELYSSGDESITPERWATTIDSRQRQRKMRIVGSQLPVLTLLHTCQDSRDAALKLYRLALNFESVVPIDTLWKDDDMVYFGYGDSKDSYDFHTWMMESDDDVDFLMKSIKHIVFCLDSTWGIALGIVRDASEPAYAWLHIFPHLETMTLMLDPGRVVGAQDGMLVLYTPEDVPIQMMGRRTATHIEDLVTKRCETVLQNSERETPLVEVVVACRRYGWARAKKQKHIKET